ncbi:twin transmembrane helix small protein [Hoeflea sp. TYP-13]|uniref:twin transmembrane helix small protein n=1 Tax=Hoeflea sp. TYP-13 TaxID=3230023 RepID=UPI0034C5F118
MTTFLYYLTMVVMAAVVFVLFRGLLNMMRGGSGNLSNKLMQMRVLLQFIAVVLIVVVLWITGGGR